ncbi:MAG: helix-turn-helix domain-containing protein [Thermodesulfobacteriota bacterium]
MLTHKELKARALARPEVKAEYNRLAEEFAFLDEFLKARAAAGITQAEVAERIGTTQSAVARLESGRGKHSPSLATLQKYAHALGCRLELRLVKETKARKTASRTNRTASSARKQAAG